MPELDYLKTPASSQQNPSKKRKQSPTPNQQQQKQQKQAQAAAAQSSQESSYSQGTIPELFAASAAHSTSTSSRPTTPPNAASSANKRHRSSIEPTAGIFKNRPATTFATESTMLSLSGSNKVIDLTDSPPNTRDATTSGGKVNMPNFKTPRPPTFQPQTGVRKLVVKNLRQTPRTSPDVYYEQTWKSLDAALTAIFNEQPISTSLEELYRGTENLCRGDRSASTYKKLEARCDQYVKGKLKDELNERAGRSDDEVVKAVEAAWAKWCQQLNMIRSIFFYLDRSYLLTVPNQLTIWDTGLKLFGKHIASDPKIGPRFLRGIFNLFEHDRKSQGEIIDMSLLLSCIRLISDLGLYADEFEPKFIAVSRDYFARVAAEESQKGDLAGYLAECTNHLEQETARCERFHLELSTKREIVAALELEMVSKQMDMLTDITSIGELLAKTDMTSLTRLYSLLERVGDAGQAIKPAWEKYITTHGLKIVQDEQREMEMVPRLLEFKGSLDKTWTGAFKKKEVLGYSLRESFSTFINARNPRAKHQNNSKPAEMIAKYVDLLLRSGVKAITAGNVATGTAEDAEGGPGAGDEDAELAQQLENVLDLFRFIHGKDVFEAFYKKDLARRLLMGRSASADAERIMLAKLKTECGSGFTHNLEAMFKDMELSKDTMQSFKNSKVGFDRAKGIDLNVNILSMSAWPTYPETTVSLPEDLEQYLKAFEDFYTQKHKGRKLKWRHALAQSVIKANFPKGKKELVVSAFQAVVLLLFNDAAAATEGLSYGAIKKATDLSDAELIRTLQSLACGKHRVLTKNPKGRDINPTDIFTINNIFKDDKFRVKINQIQLKETKEENKETHERVAQDRQYETQAAIIRIMKARKTIKHVELIAQTIEQTQNRGVLEISEIKQNIERLIDKEYMERVDDDMYRYVS